MAAVKTEIGQDFLEHVVDAPDFEEQVLRQEKTVANLKIRYEATPSENLLADVGRAVQRLSEWYRWQGKYRESLELKDEAITIWAELKRERARTLVQLQKALTMHLAGERDAAYARFEMQIPRLQINEELNNYLDFAHEWRGLCYARDGRFEEALADLEIALALRKERDHERHIQDTEQTISFIKNAQTEHCT